MTSSSRITALFKNPWVRRGAWTAFAVGLVPLLTNAFLWLRILPLLLNAPSGALVYDQAWGILPTRIHFRGLVVHGEDRNVQFAIAMDQGVADLNLWALTSRTIKITRLRGEGASVRALLKRAKGKLSAEKWQALPPIYGRKHPAIKTDFEKPPLTTKEGYKKISVDIENIDASAKEAWIDSVRFQGKARVRGSFLLRPSLELRIGPEAHVQVEEGRVTVADVPVLQQIVGTVSARTPNFHPVKPEGRAILEFFSGNIDLKAHFAGAAFAGYYLPPEDLKLSGGSGPLDLKIAFENGELLPTTSISLTSNELQAERAPAKASTTVSLEGRISDDKSARLSLQVQPLSITTQGPGASDSYRLSGGRVNGELSSQKPVNLGQPWPELSLEAELSQLQGDVRVVRPYLPKDFPFRFSSGELSIEGKAKQTLGQPDLKAEANIDSTLVGSLEDQRLSTQLLVQAQVAENKNEYSLKGSQLRLKNAALVEEKKSVAGWWMTTEIVHGGIEKDPLGFSGRLRGGMRDVEPFFVGYAKDVGVPAWVRGVLPLPELSFQTPLVVRQGAIAAGPLEAQSGSAKLDLKLHQQKTGPAYGALLLRVPALSFGVAFGQDEPKFKVLAGKKWFEEQP